MRIEQKLTVAAPPAMVWEHIIEPSNYVEFMDGVTRWDVEGEKRTGLGARYRMLMRVGSAEVGGLIEIVEFHPNRDLAWSSVTGIDQRGRWRLRDQGDGRTRVTFRFAYGVGGAGISGVIAERVAARPLRQRFRHSLLEVKRAVEHRRFQSEVGKGSRAPL